MPILELVPDTSSPPVSPLTESAASSEAVIALRIETKYQFQTVDGVVYHEYEFPSNRDVQNCGGYVDKLLKYRQPDIVEYVLAETPTLDRLRSSPWPVLHGRSPHIDIILCDLMQSLRTSKGGGRVSLLDHGCTVAEHFDFLDLLFRAKTDERAADILTYYGMDVAPLVLSAAKLFHQNLDDAHFRLHLAEGSDLDLPDDSFDFSMSVGVVNHVMYPRETLDHLLRVTRTGFVGALWVTGEDEGFSMLNHAGFSNYFFSRKDLAALSRKHTKGRFYMAEFVPEHLSTQPNSYVGLTDERLAGLGSYILIYTALADVPHYLQPLDFS